MAALPKMDIIADEEVGILMGKIVDAKAGLIVKLTEKCHRLSAQIDYLNGTENIELATLALRFENNPHEIFGKPDARVSDASIARMLKGKRMGSYITEFKDKYNGMGDWQAVSLSDSEQQERLPLVKSNENDEPRRKCDSSALMLRSNGKESKVPESIKCLAKRIKSDPGAAAPQNFNEENKKSPANRTFKIVTEFHGATISLEIDSREN